ncbi:hypothetical protein CYMTET_40645 [Cymbomonas tetramitiformis]|uniref:DNA mismatch repair proteins mutS family domain-containing protein n=1 Tax=Cymbomonas tetramitiformis TaxID=36881 RepID=A0AAE0C9F5_9CHLO|nr:hypothetical protein CYMTET_40645 [Cymbomonas tetramitiformis]
MELALFDPLTGQTFSVLINPERPVSKKITEITGITNEMVNRPDVPPFSKVIEQMLCFCGDGEVCFVGHNAKSFDVPFLAAEFARVEKTLPSTWRFLDSLQIAKALEWDLHDSGRPDKLNQQALRRHFSLEALRRDPSCSIQAHRALDDAWVLSHILESMLAPLGSSASLELYMPMMFQMGSAGEKLGLPPGRVTRAQSQQQQGADAILDDGPGSMAVHLKDVKKHDLPEMMQHYITIKEKHPGSLLMYRVGEFYECFFEDAMRLGSTVDVQVTAKNVGKAVGKVPMSGVPARSIDEYLRRLVNAGCTVVVVDQLEAAGKTKGLVKRGVTRILTPGTLTEDALLDSCNNNYLASVIIKGKQPMHWGLAYADISTGEFAVTDGVGMPLLVEELGRLQPAEVLIPVPREEAGTFIKAGGTSVQLPEGLPNTFNYSLCKKRDFEESKAAQRLKDFFSLPVSLQALGCEERDLCVRAAGGLLAYVSDSHAGAVPPLNMLSTYSTSQHLRLDSAARRNLEVVESLRWGGVRGSLLSVLDTCQTRMGSRCLRRWLLEPLRDPAAIHVRQDAVQTLKDEHALRSAIQRELAVLSDFERITTHISKPTPPSPGHLIALSHSLRHIPSLGAMVADAPQCADKTLDSVLSRFHPLPSSIQELGESLTRAIGNRTSLEITSDDDDNMAPSTGAGLFTKGYDDELDQGLLDLKNDREWLRKVEERERTNTGIPELRVAYNKVLGYHISIPRNKAKRAKLPKEYEPQSSLKVELRYLTRELRDACHRILYNEEQVLARAQELLRDLGMAAARCAGSLRQVAGAVAELDVLASLAQTAVAEGYCRPTILPDQDAQGQPYSSNQLIIAGGRHPVVERSPTLKEAYVANDVALGKISPDESVELIVLTGPNASGKSCFMRQIALIQLLAQTGSFVPADSATLSICDRIFTRVGAVDDVAAGQSTFTVEMAETAEILAHATPRSLVLLDEVGRGTSSADGLAIARAIAEYLATRLHPRTIFATHYHELSELVGHLPGTVNFQVVVSRDEEGHVVFEHRVEPGAATASFGVQVARLAGLPAEVIMRAEALLEGDDGAAERCAHDAHDAGHSSNQKRPEEELPDGERLRVADPTEQIPVAPKANPAMQATSVRVTNQAEPKEEPSQPEQDGFSSSALGILEGHHTNVYLAAQVGSRGVGEPELCMRQESRGGGGADGSSEAVHMSGISFSSEQWSRLMRQVEEISDAIEAVQMEREGALVRRVGHLDAEQRRSVNVGWYKDDAIVSIRDVDIEGQFTGDKVILDSTQWYRLLMATEAVEAELAHLIK